MKEGFFSKAKESIKKAVKTGVLIGATGAALVPKESEGQTQRPKEREPIYVSDPNDPQLKAYDDSLRLFNLSNTSDFDVAKANRTHTFFGLDNVDNIKEIKKSFENRYHKYGSTITYSKTKRPLPNDLSKQNVYDADSVTKYKNNKPIGFWNREAYDGYDMIAPGFSNDGEKYVAPRTDFIEDQVDREELKKIFPKITEQDIKKELADDRQNPSYVKRGTSIHKHDGSSFRTEKEGTNFKQESLVNNIQTIQESIPLYAKPKQQVYLKGGEPKLDKEYAQKEVKKYAPDAQFYQGYDFFEETSLTPGYYTKEQVAESKEVVKQVKIKKLKEGIKKDLNK